MELLEIMRCRRSIRKYGEETIPAEKKEAYELNGLKWEKVHI